MPITSRASLGRSSCTTWSADSSRGSRCFRRMNMNPWFPPPPPRAPAFEKNDSALGSPLTTRFTCSWCSTSERKEIPSRAPVIERPLEAPLVDVEHGVEPALQREVRLAVLLALMPQEAAAEHRRERQ